MASWWQCNDILIWGFNDIFNCDSQTESPPEWLQFRIADKEPGLFRSVRQTDLNSSQDEKQFLTAIQPLISPFVPCSASDPEIISAHNHDEQRYDYTNKLICI